MADTVRSYRDLIVWQRSMELFDLIDEIVESLTPYRRFWLGSQMHRAALSIISNIADGHGADYRGVYLRRLSDAKSSTTELETQLLVVARRRYASDAPTLKALERVDEVGRMLRGLSRSLRRGARG
jgi:four helix bundle protein